MRSVLTSRLGLTLALLLLVLLALTWESQALTMRNFDESWLALSAVEMARRHEYLIVYYLNRPDLWNTKPPLLIWLQSLSIQAFGVSEFSVRLPSLVAATATAMGLYWFGGRALRSWRMGGLAALILVTSAGFNWRHLARTADYDALLTLWLAGAALAFFAWLHTDRPRWLWAAAALQALAFMTKSAAAMLPLPGLALALLLVPAWRARLARPVLYAAGVAMVLPLAGYYALREAADAGYLTAVWANDWGGRFGHRIVFSDNPWWYYIFWLLGAGSGIWALWLAVGVWRGWQSPLPVLRQFTRFALCYVGANLLLISVAQTRLVWYSASLFPMTSLLAAIGVAAALDWARPRYPRWALVAAPTLLVAGSGAYLLFKIHRMTHEETRDWQARYGHHLPEVARLHPPTEPLQIVCEQQPWNGALQYFLLPWQAQRRPYRLVPGTPAGLATLRVGQKLFVCNDVYARRLHQRFALRELGPVGPCQYVEITAQKADSTGIN